MTKQGRRWITIVTSLTRLLMASLPTAAQHPPAGLPMPEVITARQGLSQAFVPAIVQDRQGFIWMATRDGLCRYDGYTFRVFQPGTSGRSSLASSSLSNLLMDDQGQIWVSTDRQELDRFNPLTEQFVHVARQPAYRRAVGHDTVNVSYPGHRNVLWLGVRGKGLLRLSLTTGRYRRFSHQPTDPRSLSDNQINAVLEDRRGTVWVATQKGLNRIDPATGQVTRFMHRPGDPTSIPDDTIEELYRRANGELWLHSRHHLTRWHPQTTRAQSFAVNGINAEYPHQIATDQQGNDYIISDGQLLTYDEPGGLRVISPPGTARLDRALFIDRSAVLWVGTNLAGVYKFNLRATDFFQQPYRRSFQDDLLTDYFRVPLAALPDWPTQTVSYDFRSAIDAKNRLWFTVGGVPTGAPVYRLDRPGGRPEVVPFPVLLRGVPFLQPTVLATDPRGQVWVVHPDWCGFYESATRRWIRFPHPLQPAVQSTMLQAVVDRRALWIATSNRGLYRVDRQTGAVRQFTTNPRDSTSLSSNELYCLNVDPLDINGLWVGTFGSGLCHFDKRTGRSRRITTRQGLPNNVIYAAIPDRLGSVWVATNQGLGQLNRQTGRVRVYTQEDGLSADEFNRFHAIVLSGPMHRGPVAQPAGERIVLGGIAGLTSFDPARMQADTYQPTVQLTDILVNDRSLLAEPSEAAGPMGLLQTLRLSHDRNFITIRFAGMQYNRLGRLQYRYQLAGLASGWVVTSRPEAVYTALLPGTYRLQIQAANTAGQWSRYTRQLTLIIAPPWWATGWAYCLYGLLGGLLGYGLIHNWTSRLRLRQSIAVRQREAEQLRNMDAMKDRFFTNITHELRTPLTLLLGASDQLLARPSADTVDQRARLIQRQTQQLLGLTNELLELARLEAGSVPVTERLGQPGAYVSELIAGFGQEATQRGIELHNDLSDGGSYWFDAIKLERIVNNLVANALDFTPRGGSVTVELAATPAVIAGRPAGVILRVVDTGTGMTVDQLAHIFDRFYQASVRPSASGRAGRTGTGIGLSLVRELVELQGGTITVASEPGQGTTFTLWLPYRPALPADALATEPLSPAVPVNTSLVSGLPTAAEATDAAASPLLLLVEDNDELAWFLVDCLRPAYRIRRAADGQEGLDLARQLMPELIVSDVMMPRLTGYQLCQQLKTDPRTDHIPVLLLTAGSSLESRLQGLSLGADEYLSKPFHLPELLLRINNLLVAQRRLRQRLQAELTAPPTDPATAGAAPAEVHPFIAKLYEVLDAHLDESGFGVEGLAAGINLSRMQLHRKLKALTALSTTEFIRTYRLQRALPLLAQGLPVSQVAYTVGFESPSWFSHCFREQFGQSPSGYGPGAAKTG